jgi:cob(I)alamin adenosyltransferase
MRVYTKSGDDGTTGLFHGGRVPKDDARPTAYGSVDEAQAAIGFARAETEPEGELDRVLIGLCRDLYVVMAELATLPENRHKLEPGRTLVTEAMVTAVEQRIDSVSDRFDPPTDFVVPGANRTAAALDLARTVARRAEREALAAVTEGSRVVPYLNRLSDLLWVLARWQEDQSILTRSVDGPAPAS